MKKTINTFLSFMCILILIPHFFCGNWNDLDNGNSFSSRQLKGIAESYINDKNNILGTIIKVDIQGKKSYAAACGYTDPSRSMPLNDPDTKFIIGSVNRHSDICGHCILPVFISCSIDIGGRGSVICPNLKIYCLIPGNCKLPSRP